jgi:hypothetical protein
LPVSPRLNALSSDGHAFLSFAELKQRADQAEQRTAQLGARLRDLGIAPESAAR